jgi:hypothetical protein
MSAENRSPAVDFVLGMHLKTARLGHRCRQR